MATRLVLLPYLQHWDGTAVAVRLLVIPRGNPLDPLSPGTPNFPQSKFTFDVHLSPGLDALPSPSNAPFATIGMPAVAGALQMFDALSSLYDIDPAPPGAVRGPGTRVQKHLPLSYRQAAGYAPGITPLVFTDNTYLCAIQAPAATPYKRLPPANPKIGWGKVIAILLRNPKLAAAAGLIRTLTIPVAPTDLLKNGAFLHVTLAASSDAAGLLQSVDGLKLYATRIPHLQAPRDLFTPVFFPVANPPPALNYDLIFAECDDYDDGWAKVVHCAQPQQIDPLNEVPDGTRPVKEIGIRLGWDDEQVTMWLNRQLDPGEAGYDSPLGVFGYKVDARLSGTGTWHSLVRASGPLSVGSLAAGTFDGELGVEIHPVQLEAKKQGIMWLPTYFTNWSGPPLVTLDNDMARLSGGPDRSASPRVKGVFPGVQLTYGKSYEFRVRFMDHTGGGPALTGAPAVPGPSPIGTIPFRRWIRPLAPVASKLPPATPDPANPTGSLTLTRPLLHHPAVASTGYYPDPVDAILADIPAARAGGREPGLPDPDVDRVQVTVEALGLSYDAATTDGPFVPLYQTTRAFPSDPSQPLTLAFSWADVNDVTKMTPPPTGALILPTARTLRLNIAALCRDDPGLAYFGSQDVRVGPIVQITLRKNATSEKQLFASDLPSHRFCAVYLRPDPVIDPIVLFAQRAAGALNQRPTDIASRLAATLGLRNDGLTMRAQPGRRVVFGCARAVRHVTGPDGASLTFMSQTDIAQHWLVVLRLTIDRDWSWDGLAAAGIQFQRDGIPIGSILLPGSLGSDATMAQQRSQTDLVFIDAIDPKPASGDFPKVQTPGYTVTPQFAGTPAKDVPLGLSISLPVASPPTQVPKVASAGIAMSPYERSADYSATQIRRRALWIELDEPVADARDGFFARVLRYAPDPLLVRSSTGAADAAEPPLAVDPEWVRVIVEEAADDRAGIDAMQALLPSDSPRHWMLPLPPGMNETSAELFGFFTYELRVGHAGVWSTAQGRFGAPLRVAGVQHPPPPMQCAVLRNTQGVYVSAAFAPPAPGPDASFPGPRTSMSVLLYAQAEQIDGADRRNVLLGHKEAQWPREAFKLAGRANAYGEASFGTAEVELALEALGFASNAPLSVLAVELLPQAGAPADPLGADLGKQRILRSSALTPVPIIC